MRLRVGARERRTRTVAPDLDDNVGGHRRTLTARVWHRCGRGDGAAARDCRRRRTLNRDVFHAGADPRALREHVPQRTGGRLMLAAIVLAIIPAFAQLSLSDAQTKAAANSVDVQTAIATVHAK